MSARLGASVREDEPSQKARSRLMPSRAAQVRAQKLRGDSHSQRRQRAWVLGEQIGLREERSVLWYASDVRKPRCRIKPSAASAVYGGRKTADKKARPRLAPSSGAEIGEIKCHWQEDPASACAEPGRRPLGRESWGSKLPLAIYLWKKRRFSYFGSQHTLMPSVR